MHLLCLTFLSSNVQYYMSCTTPTMQAMWVVIELSTLCNACTGGLACTQPYASMCVTAKCASRTSTYINSQQANSYPCLSLKPHGVTVDRITNLPKTKQGFTAILVVVDRLTKMTHFMPCKNESTAHDIARQFVDNIMVCHCASPLTEVQSLQTSLLLRSVNWWGPCTTNPLPIILSQIVRLSA